MDSSNSSFLQYSRKSKNICTYTTISIILILIMIIPPFNKIFIASLIGKIIILLILAYSLYENFNNTNFLSNATNTSVFKGSWTNVKTNILYNYVYSFLILLLIFSLIKNIL